MWESGQKYLWTHDFLWYNSTNFFKKIWLPFHSFHSSFNHSFFQWTRCIDVWFERKKEEETRKRDGLSRTKTFRNNISNSYFSILGTFIHMQMWWRVLSLSLSLSLKAFYQNDVDVRRVQILAFVAGYQTQDFATTFYGWFIGTSLAVAICVPDWWFYNQFPVEFLDEIPEPTTRSRIHGGRKKKRRNK